MDTFYIFDALGRMRQEISGAGQTSGYAYDANGNNLTVTDPLAAYRAGLRRPQPAGQDHRSRQGIATAIYDAQTADPCHRSQRGATSYVFDGFGRMIQRVSPDAGTAVYRYDLNGNLTQSVDAAGATVNYATTLSTAVTAATYPALRRERRLHL